MHSVAVAAPYRPSAGISRHRLLLVLLAAIGVLLVLSACGRVDSTTEIAADGKPFDPTLHQAVQTVPVQDGQKPDTVVQVLQAGYQLKDRVLRPAMVVVAQ